jgi:hypothetical protein
VAFRYTNLAGRGISKIVGQLQGIVGHRQADPTVRPRLRLISIASCDDESRSRT